jgi:hypothetical protein
VKAFSVGKRLMLKILKFLPRFAILLVLDFTILNVPSRNAFSAPLSYSQRTKSYSGWSSALRGDSISIGTGGGAYALPESISASEINPAAYSFSLESLEAQLNRYTIQDQFVNRTGATSHETQGGISVSIPPWGFGVSSFTTSSELGKFETAQTPTPFDATVYLTEYHFSLSRVVIRDVLSLGVAAEIVKAKYELDRGETSATKILPRVGAIYQFADHLFLSSSYRPGVRLTPGKDIGGTQFPGFSMPVDVPPLLSAGFAWLPNRFYRIGLNVTVPFGRPGSALLADENVLVGEKTTIQPHLGMSYVITEFANFKVEASVGSYLEVSRISDRGNRFHKTAAIDINPYFVNTSFGFDSAPQYRNFVASVGIDIVRAARFLDLIPQNSLPPLNGLFPNPTTPSPEGLPGGMTVGHPDATKGPDIGEVGKIIQDLPKKIEEKLNLEKKPIEPPSLKIEKASDTPAPHPKRRLKRVKRKKQG